jgi:hypothetical protein
LLLKNFSKDRKVIDIFKGAFPYVGKFFWLSLFTSGLILLWSLLLIIPGIIFAVYYSFVVWVFVFENKTGMDAVNRSKELVKGRWWDVFFRYIALLGGIIVVYLLLSSIPLPTFLNSNSIAKGIWQAIILIIQFLITPLPVIYSYFLYKDLGGKAEASLPNTATGETKPINKTTKNVLIALGVVIFIIIAFGASFFIKMYLQYKDVSKELDKINSASSSITSNISTSTSEEAPKSINPLDIIEEASTKSRDAKRVADAKQIQVGIEMYFNDHEKYPDVITALSEYQITDFKDPQGNDYKYTKTKDNYQICFILERDKDNYKKGENCLDKDSQ